MKYTISETIHFVYNNNNLMDEIYNFRDNRVKNTTISILKEAK